MSDEDEWYRRQKSSATRKNAYRRQVEKDREDLAEAKALKERIEAEAKALKERIEANEKYDREAPMRTENRRMGKNARADIYVSEAGKKDGGRRFGRDPTRFKNSDARLPIMQQILENM